MKSTKATRDRRTLRLTSLDELLAEVDRLHAQPYRRLGNWSLGQMCVHLARLMHECIDGFTFGPPRVVRWLAPLFKARLLRRGFPAGMTLKGPAAQALSPPPVSDSEGVQRLRDAVQRLQSEPQRQPSPLLGRMSREQWDQFHLRHAELHLSFLAPDANRAKTLP